MSGPWDDYSDTAAPTAPGVEAGPWNDYAQLTSADPNAPTLNMDREVGPVARAFAGVKMTPQGRTNALEYQGGPMPGQRVVTDKSGAAFVFDPDKNEYYPVDKPGFSMGDVADLSGDLIETLPTLGAGKIGKKVAGDAASYIVGDGLLGKIKNIPGVAGVAGLLGGAGGAARQIASELVPGDEDVSLEDRAKNIGFDAAANVAGEGLARGITGGIDALRPHNAMGRNLDNTMRPYSDNPLAQEGVQIEDAVPGLALTPGQKGPNRFLLSIEGYLRRNPASSDIAFKNDAKQLNAVMDHLDTTMNGLSNKEIGPEMAGIQIKSNFDKALNHVDNIRKGAANADFGLAAKLGGPGIKIPTDNTYKAIDDLIIDMNVSGGGDEAAAMVGRLKALRTEIGNNGIGVSPNEMNRLLQIYGKASTGTGNPIKDITDKAQQRMIAGRVARGLSDDLDQAVDTNPGTSAAARALKTARDNYKSNSQAVNELTDSVLGGIVNIDGPARPERLAEKLYTMKPSEIRSTFKIINNIDPVAGNEVKRQMLEAAIEKGRSAPGQRKIGGVNYSTSGLIASLEKSPVLEVLDTKEKARITQSLSALARLTDRAGTDGSPTQILTWIDRLVSPAGFKQAAIGGLGAGGIYAATGDPQLALAGATVGGLTAAVAARKMARIMFDPAAVSALRVLKETGPKGQRGMRAATYLSTLLGAEETGLRNDKVAPNPDARIDQLQGQAQAD